MKPISGGAVKVLEISPETSLDEDWPGSDDEAPEQEEDQLREQDREYVSAGLFVLSAHGWL
jgi:hypothetical protein